MLWHRVPNMRNLQGKCNSDVKNSYTGLTCTVCVVNVKYKKDINVIM